MRTRLWLAGLLPFLLSALLAGPAHATTIVGNTWFSDGSFYKQAPAGTAVSVFATGARPNRLFRLVAQPGDTVADFPCAGINRIQLHPSLRGSTSRGLIPTTTVVLNGPPGDYEICFYEEPVQPGGSPPSATAPVFLTLL